MIRLMLVLFMFCIYFYFTIRIQIFAVHAIGGLIGNILTGFFAQASVAGFDGTTAIPGGYLDHHWTQLGFQFANSFAGMAYTFVMTVRDLLCHTLSY
jgi:Amt family ammonium transporter